MHIYSTNQFGFHSFVLLLLSIPFLVIILVLIFEIKTKKSIVEFLIHKGIRFSVNSSHQEVLFKCVPDSLRPLRYISKNIIELTGYLPDELINNKQISFIDLIHPDDRGVLMDAIKNCTPQNKNYKADYRIITKDKDEKWVTEQGICYFDRTKKIVRLEGILTDISDRKFTEKNLIESERRFQLLIEKAPIGICISFENLITYGNPVFVKMLGYSQQIEILSTPLTKYIIASDKEKNLELIQSFTSGIHSQLNIDTVGICKNGSLIPIQVYLTRVNLGDYEATLTFILDITEQKRSLDNLLSLNQRLNDIIDLIPDPTFIIDKNKKVIHWNKSMEDLTKVSKENILGKDVGDCSIPFYGEKTPMMVDLLDDEIEFSEQQQGNVTKALKKIGNKLYGNFSGSTFDNKAIHLWGVAAPLFDSEGNRFGTIEVLKDITLRKNFEIALQEAEERYRTVFDQSGLANNVYDVDGILIMQNTIAASMLGGKPSDFTGKLIDELYSAETARTITSQLHETILNGKPIFDEREFQLPTGKYWLKTTNHIIKNALGQVIGVQFISQDITESKLLDRKILNTIIETEEKERLHFAQELHDGLGPIISAVKMYVQWLSRPDSKIAQCEIISDTERLINEAGEAIREISFKLSPHILNNFGLIAAINSFTSKINQSKQFEILLDYNFTARFEKTVEIVIYRILCECMNNTIKHANATQISIKMLKFITKIRITYTDNGIGFNINEISAQKKGNGLLNMQSRLQSINGSSVINSQPGKGVKIMITIRL